MASRPGTFVINGHSPAPKIHVITYGPETVLESDPDAREVPSLLKEGCVTWIDVQGLGDEAVLRNLAQALALHPLALADVVNIPQRPKVEPYDEHLFLVARMARFPESRELETEQVSLFLGRNYVLTFQERHGDVLAPLRERIRVGKGPIRRHGSDYLAYAVLDAVIDGYYPVLESLGECLEDLEEDAARANRKTTLHEINRNRHMLVTFRRILSPQRDAINALIRDDNELVSEPVRIYLRDCHDHCMQISEVLESYREIASSLTSTYLSALSNRTNDVMKVLTIMASIFIPLTFMAGIYGMNFEHMPELHARFGYPLLWLAMTVVAVGMLVYFRRKGWLGSDDDEK